MSFHEFSVTLKEKLSPPTEEDQQRELPDDNNEDKAGPEWRLLRLRYMTRPTFSTGSKTAVYLPHSNPDVEHVTNDGQHGTPRKVASKTGISAVETEQRIFAENNRRFEPHFIELDAGLVDKVMHEVATMMTEGKRSNPLRRAYEKFQKRGGSKPKNMGKEQHIQNLFCDLANEVARELHSRKPGSYQDENGLVQPFNKEHDVFLSKGSVYVKESSSEPDDHEAKDHEDQQLHTGWHHLKPQTKLSRNKPDIFINAYRGRPNDTGQFLWSDLPAVAEVKASANLDSRESLVLQIHRYQMNQSKCQPSVGEIVSLSVCDDIVRGWATTCQRYSSTRGFKLDDKKDHYDIVKLIALFSGPIQNYLPHWQPLPGRENALKMVTPEKELFDLELCNIKLLDSRKDRFGRRTAVWSADAAANDERLPFQYDPKGEQLVIKGSWQIEKLCDHEHDVFEHIAKREKELGLTRDPDIHIPIIVGRLAAADGTGEDREIGGGNKPANCPLVNWKTRSTRKDTMANGGETEHAKYTVVVTKCFRAQSIGQVQLNPLQLVIVYRKLFKILEYLAKLGIHYRDVSLGNVLVDTDPVDPRCLLADFDFSRIEMKRRGSHDEAKPLETSIDDCVSGTRLFWSRNTEAGSRQSAVLTANAAQLKSAQQLLAKAEETSKPNDIAVLEAKSSVARWKEKQEELEDAFIQRQHRYIDDLESAIYTLLYYAATITRSVDPEVHRLLDAFSDPDQKNAFWNDKWQASLRLVKAIDLPQPFAKLIYELGQAIESAQKTVHQAPAKVALHEAEIKCYIDCQQAFIEAEISLGSEAATKPVALQHAIEYENDPLEISAIGEDIAALSVLGDEVSMNEHASQPRQSTEKPSADRTKGTTSPADSNHDHQQGKGGLKLNEARPTWLRETLRECVTRITRYVIEAHPTSTNKRVYQDISAFGIL